MASNRLQRTGSIFQRLTGIIRAGAMKEKDIPLWYEIYKAFPPKHEPAFTRPAVEKEILPIFYAEDKIRAKFRKLYGSRSAHNLLDSSDESVMQRYVDIYSELESSGKITSEDDLVRATESALEKEGISFIRDKKIDSPSSEQKNLTGDYTVENKSM